MFPLAIGLCNSLYYSYYHKTQIIGITGSYRIYTKESEVSFLILCTVVKDHCRESSSVELAEPVFACDLCMVWHDAFNPFYDLCMESLWPHYKPCFSHWCRGSLDFWWWKTMALVPGLFMHMNLFTVSDHTIPTVVCQSMTALLPDCFL